MSWRKRWFPVVEQLLFGGVTTIWAFTEDSFAISVGCALFAAVAFTAFGMGVVIARLEDKR